MGDINAINPIASKLSCIDGVYKNVQSRDHVSPIQLLMAKETKESYKAFKGFFDFFAMASNKSKCRDRTPFFWAAIEDFEEIELTTTMDLSASWKGLQKGGTCKQKRFFCHCCPLQSEHLHHPNDTKCDRYC